MSTTYAVTCRHCRSVIGITASNAQTLIIVEAHRILCEHRDRWTNNPPPPVDETEAEKFVRLQLALAKEGAQA